MDNSEIDDYQKNIRNVKISVLYRSSVNDEHFRRIAKDRNAEFRRRRNFIVIKDIYPITIFPKGNNHYHFNITGIKSLSIVPRVISWLNQYYCFDDTFEVIRHSIDNITAAFDLRQELSLHLLATHLLGSTYNPERFPAFFYKNDKTTALIFSSGKVNILGCKSEHQVLQAWKHLQAEISVARMSKI